MVFQKNLFVNNYAKFEGGTIKWKEIEPVINNDNIFLNNKAIYGDINAAFPYRIEMEYSKESEIVCLQPLKNCYVTLPNLASGSQLNFSIVFSIKDIYNETCRSFNEGLIRVDYFFLKSNFL